MAEVIDHQTAAHAEVVAVRAAMIRVEKKQIEQDGKCTRLQSILGFNLAFTIAM